MIFLTPVCFRNSKESNLSNLSLFFCHLPHFKPIHTENRQLGKPVNAALSIVLYVLNHNSTDIARANSRGLMMSPIFSHMATTTVIRFFLSSVNPGGGY